MSRSQIIKQVHAAMRAAGYERQPRALVVGAKVYKTLVLNDHITVKVPGNWSMKMSERIQDELFCALAEAGIACKNQEGMTGAVCVELPE